MTFRPIPESVQAELDYGPLVDSEELLAEMLELAAQVCVIVPECVAMSVSSCATGVSFTLVSADLAGVEAENQSRGTSCRVAPEGGLGASPRAFEQLCDEESWQTLAMGTAAHGVLSSLTLPVMEAGRVVGSVDLYASTRTAFDAHHQQLATVFGAWADGAVSNADLSFETQRVSEQASAILRRRAR